LSVSSPDEVASTTDYSPASSTLDEVAALVFCNVICSWKINLNDIFEDITFRGMSTTLAPAPLRV
jgi:hypothetical protein